MNRVTTALLVCGAAAATVSGVLVITRDGSNPGKPPGTHARPDQQPMAGPALDDVAGLGSSPAGRARDELISVWEAWRRDTLIARCMERSGFEWIPEVLYPEEEITNAANALDVVGGEPQSPSPTPPEDVNQSIEDSLDSDDRNLYLLALTGETARDIDYANRTERVPEGRDGTSFAQGGCRGEAKAAVGSLWDLKRALAVDLDKFRQRIRDTDAYQGRQTTFPECVASFGFQGIDDPRELRELEDSDPAARKSAEEIDYTCTSWWRAVSEARAVEVAFRAGHRAAIAKQLAKYAGVMGRIRADGDFIDYLAVAAR